MQVMNEAKPNSNANTIIFAYGEVTDTHENVWKIILYFDKQIEEI